MTKNIIIYSKENCAYCEGAKLLCSTEGLIYEEIKIGKDITLEEFMDTHPGVRTMPLIVIDKVKVGGYQEFKTYINSMKDLGSISL